MEESCFHTYILAAGRSSRLGQSKHLLIFRDKPVIDHVIDTARTLGECTYSVVVSPESDVAHHLKQQKVPLLVNHAAHLGIGHSIAWAVQDALDRNMESCLLLLGDQPLIPPLHLQSMVKKWENQEQHIVGTRYCDGNIGIPVIFPKRLFSLLSQWTGDGGAKDLIRHDSCIAPVSLEQRYLRDLDTPRDLKRLES